MGAGDLRIDGIWRYRPLGEGKAQITGVTDNLTGDVSVPEQVGGLRVASLGDYSLACLYGVRSLHLPSRVKEVGWGFAKECPALESVDLPDELEILPPCSFMNCERLTSVSFESVVRIGYMALFETAISSVVAPRLVEVGDAAMLGCSLIQRVEVPLLKGLGRFSFYRCSSLQKLTLPSSLEELPSSAFGYCKSLESVEMLGSVSTLDAGAFNGCEKVVIRSRSQQVRDFCITNAIRCEYDEL